MFIGNYGIEADVWAAGMMMYQLLSGRFPYWPSMESLYTTSLEEVHSRDARKALFVPWFRVLACESRFVVPSPRAVGTYH